MRKYILLCLLLVPYSHATENSDYVLSFDVHGIMEHVLYPAAAIVWGNAGFVITNEGEEDLSPTTEEGWHNVEDHAAMVMETANLLLLPGRGPEEVEWRSYSKDLVRTGKLAFNAAQNRDAVALFDAGGEIYQSCLACHQKYIVKNE